MKIALVSMMLVAVACSADPATDESTLTGVVTDIESSGLNEVTSFQLRHDGETTTIYIDEEVDYGFPLGHLSAHMSGAEPVGVKTDERDGKLYALSIDDV
ncbi:MAG: hypothetical protein ACRDI3_08280 [Actinomycetota bacterium]